MKKLLSICLLFSFLFLPAWAEEVTESLSLQESLVTPPQMETATAPILRPKTITTEDTVPILRSSTITTGETFPSFTSSTPSYPLDLDSDLTVRMQIVLNLRKIYIDADTGSTNELDFRGYSLSLTADLRDRVRVFLKANLSHLFEYRNTNKIDFNSDFKWEDFIDNAYIEFREINGSPMAVVFGKRDLVFNLHEFTKVVPIPYTFWENYQARYDVIALTVKYDDQVELTIYEGENGEQGDNYNEGEGDFDIEEGSLGFLIRVTRELGPNTDLTASYNKQKNEHLGFSEPEEKITTGVKIEINDRVSSWIEGMYILQNPPLGVNIGDKGNWGTSFGLAYQVSEDLTFVGNYNHIEELTRELGLGFFMSCFFCSGQLKDQSQIKFQIYHSEYPERGWEKDTLYGVSWTIVLDQILYGQ